LVIINVDKAQTLCYYKIKTLKKEKKEMYNNKIERERMNVYISTDLKKKIQEKANELGINMSAFISICVNEYLKQDSVVDLVTMYKELQKELKNE
jgi:post-segregation antitoxin (ccd killing protein)